VGIDDTGVKAAFLKCAVESHGMIGDVPRILAAIAAASVETGAPVMVHTNAAERTGLLALEALTRDGVDPSRIVIAHMGDSNDMGYLREVAQSGVWLGLDRFGIDHFNPLADRISTLLALLEAGYGDRVQLSHDASCFMDFMTGDPFFAGVEADYLLITRDVLPALRAAGVGDADIDLMMVENPRRFFEAAGTAGAPALEGAGAEGGP
jgi:phosphotriesterase-related protein